MVGEKSRSSVRLYSDLIVRNLPTGRQPESPTGSSAHGSASDLVIQVFIFSDYAIRSLTPSRTLMARLLI